MPAAAVIPAPLAYVKAAAVKTLVVVVSLVRGCVSQKDARSLANYTCSVRVNSHTLSKP